MHKPPGRNTTETQNKNPGYNTVRWVWKSKSTNLKFDTNDIKELPERSDLDRDF